MDWTVQRYCTDIDQYELIVEQQKSSWNCEQKVQSWRWNVAYSGAVVAQGVATTAEDAKALAVKNVPQ